MNFKFLLILSIALLQVELVPGQHWNNPWYRAWRYRQKWNRPKQQFEKPVQHSFGDQPIQQQFEKPIQHSFGDQPVQPNLDWNNPNGWNDPKGKNWNWLNNWNHNNGPFWEDSKAGGQGQNGMEGQGMGGQGQNGMGGQGQKGMGAKG